MPRAKNNVSAKSKNKTLAFRFGARPVGTDEEAGKEIWAPHVIWENQYVDVTAVEAMQAEPSIINPQQPLPAPDRVPMVSGIVGASLDASR